MAIAVYAAGLVALAAWIWLLLWRDGFWRADQRLPWALPELESWPAVAVVVPARDEAAVVGEAAAGLAAQDYPGPVSIVLVDDGSSDDTAAAALRGARRAGRPERLTIIDGAPLPAEWTGKMWAVHQGVAEALRRTPKARYVWLTDADIAHPPDKLRRLVAMAEHGGYDLVSLMVRLHAAGLWERLLVPAFVFFFQKLYPFPAVNDPRRRVAGAAGGCLLVRAAALTRAGGIPAIRGELIDDCALARRIKAGGPIWLGLARRSRSLRPYDGLGEIWRMVARTAYTQLGHSPAMLAATVVAMAAIYLGPPGALVAGLWTGAGDAAAAGGAAMALMCAAYWPTWRLYGRLSLAFFALPAAAALYTAMTIDSARRHWRGAGGSWKGRSYGPGGRGKTLGSQKSPG